jgi:hypothetical protein
MGIEEGKLGNDNNHRRDIVKEYLGAAKLNGGVLVFAPSERQREALKKGNGKVPHLIKSKMEGGVPVDKE